MSFLGLRRGLLLDRPGEYQGNGAPSASTLAKGNYRRGARYWDYTNQAFYICATLGTETTAVWSQVGGSAAPIVSEVAGTGAGDYTHGGDTNYTDVPGMAITVTVPTGQKATIEADFVWYQNTANNTVGFVIADGTTALREKLYDATLVTGHEDGHLSALFVGDGASHTFKLRFKTFAAAEAVAVDNATATRAPVLRVRIEATT